MVKTITVLIVSCLLFSCTPFREHNRIRELDFGAKDNSLLFIVAYERGQVTTIISPDPKETFLLDRASVYSFEYIIPINDEISISISPKIRKISDKSNYDQISSLFPGYYLNSLKDPKLNYNNITDVLLPYEVDFIENNFTTNFSLRYFHIKDDHKWVIVQNNDNKIAAIDLTSNTVYDNNVLRRTDEMNSRGDIFDPESLRYYTFRYSLYENNNKKVKLTDEVLCWDILKRKIVLIKFVDPDRNEFIDKYVTSYSYGLGALAAE